MPFSIQQSGKLAWVLAEAKKQAETFHKGFDKGDKIAKAGLDRVHKFLDSLKLAVSEFPDDSDAGLVLVGDAGENHFSISNLNFSASKPVAPANLEDHPVPVKGEPGNNKGVPIKEQEKK